MPSRSDMLATRVGFIHDSRKLISTVDGPRFSDHDIDVVSDTFHGEPDLPHKVKLFESRKSEPGGLDKVKIGQPDSV